MKGAFNDIPNQEIGNTARSIPVGEYLSDIREEQGLAEVSLVSS